MPYEIVLSLLSYSLLYHLCFCEKIRHFFLAEAVQSTFNLWVSRTQNLFSEVATPLVKNVNDITPNSGDAYDTLDIEDNFMAEQTIDSRTPKGTLSVTAITSIEQFSR